jgi:DNA-directed RNA polymerase specialized sigma24 family protein
MADHSGAPEHLYLSDCEWQVIQQILEGRSIEAIEEELGLPRAEIVQRLRSAIRKVNRAMGYPLPS